MTEALSYRAGGFHLRASAKNRHVAAHPAQGDSGPLTSCLGDEIHRASDAVAVHVRLESFIDLYGLDDVGRYGVEFDLAYTGFGRWNIDAIYRRVGKTRFGAADLNILALTFVAFQADAGEAAQSVGHVGVGQTADHVGSQNLYDVVGAALAIDGFGLSRGTFGGDQYLFVLRRDLEFYFHRRYLARNHVHSSVDRNKTDIRDADGVGPGLEIADEEVTAHVRRDGRVTLL